MYGAAYSLSFLSIFILSYIFTMQLFSLVFLIPKKVIAISSGDDYRSFL